MDDTDFGVGKGKGTAPPYISFRTLKTFMQDLHEHDIPGQIDRDVLKRFSGSVGKQLKTALRFLDLVDGDDRPTDGLRGLVAAYQTPDWPSALRGMLNVRYAPIFANVDLATATPSQIHTAFKDAYGGMDAVLKKGEVFFLQAVQEAEIPLSKRVSVISRQRAASPRKRNGAARTAETGKADATPSKINGEGDMGKRRKTIETTSDDPYQVLVSILDPVNMDEEERKAVFTLITYLKRREVEAALEQEEADDE